MYPSSTWLIWGNHPLASSLWKFSPLAKLFKMSYGGSNWRLACLLMTLIRCHRIVNHCPQTQYHHFLRATWLYSCEKETYLSYKSVAASFYSHLCLVVQQTWKSRSDLSTKITILSGHSFKLSNQSFSAAVCVWIYVCSLFSLNLWQGLVSLSLMITTASRDG